MTVFVVGSLHLDVVVNAPHLPALDETVMGQDVAYQFGGKGGNQAVAAASHGGAAAMAGRIGGDAFGQKIAAALSAAGVDATQVQRDDGASGMSVAIVDANGDYGAVVVSAANTRIDTAAIALPADTRIVLLQNEIPEPINLAVAQMARAQGAQVWLNAAPARDSAPEFMALVDLLIVNRIEAMFYHEALRTRSSITTLGAQGVLYDGLSFAGHSVEVVSSHGAGDCFVGALAAQAAQGVPMDAAIGYAQAAAALHVSTPVAARAGIGPAQVQAFLTPG